ncbi:MAG: DoxX family protein [Halobacteriovoraceae bacterium]|nr:DoxX family protein [Halobacteriovoraceae bacterium]
MNKKQELTAWIFQIIAAVILVPVGMMKFANGETDIYIFTQLGMEPFGRYLIGVLEILSGILLLSRNLSACGGVLGIGVMCGAILAHVSALGFEVMEDGGMHIWILLIVSLSCLVVVFLRKKQLPLIGNQL